MLAPYNDREWETLEADEFCIEGGTCRALMNLNEEWDNLPSEQSYMLFWNEKRRWMFSGITMSSILFCKHGGFIIPVISGQKKKHNFADISEFKKEYESFITEMIEKYEVQMDIEQIGKIIYVETGGIGFDNFNRLYIRFENHKFLELIKGG